jgi:Cu2+-exporting ATPase
MHDAVMVAISVLIITCPCALALAIPAVQVVAANRLFRSGIFLNSGDAIERLADADTAIFDKTGTLTLPEPHVLNAGQIAPDLLERAARLALGTRHPLAAALAKHANVQTPYDDIVETPGSGIRTVVDGIEMRLGRPEFCGVRDETVAAATLQDPRASVLAFRNGDRHAVFTIGQSLRPDAAAALKSIAGLGLDIKILSGDRPKAVAAIARSVGVSDWKGGLKPGEKVAILDTLKASGRKVLMIGDGINDAPALAAASVSLSPICAADLSQAHADGVFLGETLKPVREAIVTARRARTLMRQNLSLAVVYNALALPLAVAGLVTPLIAALAMSGSSMIVMLNSLRLGVARQDCAKTISERVQPARIARTA